MRRRALQAGLLVMSSILVAGEAQAQMPVSIVAGPTFSQLTGDDADDDNESKTGIFVGVGTNFALNETFGISPFATYVQKGTEYDEGDSLSLDYFEIPVFLTADFPFGESAGLRVYGGPHVAFNVNCDADGGDCSEQDDFNSMDFGVGGGAAVALPVSGLQLSLGGGADLGLTDVFENVEARNLVYYLFVSMAFGLGG